MSSRYTYILYILLLFTYDLSGQKPSVYEVSRMNFSENGFSDISPVMVNDGVIFCSNRRFSTVKDRVGFDGSRLYNLYISKPKDSTRWSRPEMLESDRIERFNNGPLSVSADMKTVYFTSEVVTDKQAKRRKFRNHSGIFIADLSGTRLTGIRPFAYNSNSYEVGHPSVSHDGKFLYFASDMPGGQGGSDIYYCEFINGSWSKPVNMGPKINTPKSENFPCIHPSGKLYFTSDRPGGKGRLDIWSTSFYDGAWDDPVLLPEPINSSSDDFAFCAAPDLQTGYFSSNRRADDDVFRFTSTIIRKANCSELIENSYCFRFYEENAVKYDSIPFIFRWTFSDGTKMEGATVDHCFEGPGKYYVRLDVVNLVTKELINNEKTDTVLVEDEIQPYITSADNAEPGKPLRLDASETNLPGWNITQYYWNFGDETVDTGQKVEKSWTRPGTYTVQLIVTASPDGTGKVRESCVSKNINIRSVR
jgi:hypothetical protein